MRIDYFGTVQHAKKKYAQFLSPVCDQWGLTMNELNVLLFLHNNPEYDRAADIVLHRGMTKSHVSLSVHSLQQRDFLKKVNDDTDRRTARLQLTEKALPAVQAGQELQIRFFSRIFSGISLEDAALWQRITEQVRDNLSNM